MEKRRGGEETNMAVDLGAKGYKKIRRCWVEDNGGMIFWTC